MFRAAHLALKDLRLLSRDRMALFWTFVFPVIFAVFIGSVLSSSVDSGDAKVEVTVVDEADSEASRALIQSLESSTNLTLHSERSVADADARARKGERLGTVRIPEGYGVQADRSVEVAIDPSRSNEAALLKASVAAALAKEHTRAIARAAGRAAASGSTVPTDVVPRPPGGSAVPTDAITPQMSLRELDTIGGASPKSSFDLVFPAAILWGLMGCAATFAVAMVSERTAGTFIRLRAAPMQRATLLWGKALACSIACVVDAAALLAIARLGFGVQTDRPLALALALASVSACFVGLTMFLSTLGKTEQAVSGAGWATLLLMAMLGGAMVPVAFMPDWMQRLSDISPVKWGIFALEGALWRGLTLAELAVPCAVLVGIGAAGFAAGLSLMGRAEATS